MQSLRVWNILWALMVPHAHIHDLLSPTTQDHLPCILLRTLPFQFGPPPSRPPRSAPVSVDVEYTRGKEIVVKKGKAGQGAIVIGRMPLMLRSDRCGRAGRRAAGGWAAHAMQGCGIAT